MPPKGNRQLSPQKIQTIESDVLALMDQEMLQPFVAIGVSLAKQMGRWVLRIDVENAQQPGISLEDCERVSQDINEKLDNLRSLSDLSYNLEVSSPGIDRQLTTRREFDFYQGRPVEVYTKGLPKPGQPAGTPDETGTLDGYERWQYCHSN